MGKILRASGQEVGSLAKIVIHVVPVQAKKATVMRIAAELRLLRQVQCFLDLGDQVFAVENAFVSENCEVARGRTVHHTPPRVLLVFAFGRHLADALELAPHVDMAVGMPSRICATSGY